MSGPKAPGMRFLVVIETRKVKGYLMASTLLRETRGASLLLDRLNREETRELLETTCAPDRREEIYLGGGSGRALFRERCDADTFARGVRDLYRRKTGSARLVARVVARREGESFADWVRRGVEEAHRETPQGPEEASMIHGRWIRPCTSCGVEPASVVKDRIPEEHRVCESCHRKREQIWNFYHNPKYHSGQKGMRALGIRPETNPIPNIDEMEKEWPNSILTTVLKRLLPHEQEKQPEGEERLEAVRLRLPQDFNHIGEAASPSRYFGFLYADANGMGEIIRKLSQEFETEEELKGAYKALSEIVDEATREAAAEAVLAEVPAVPEKAFEGVPVRYLPAEFIIAGGDDLILAVPAQAALGVAWRFVEGFQKKTRELQREWIAKGRLSRAFAPKGLTTSAGVVLSHVNVPAVLLLDLAEDLLKLAKEKAARGLGGGADQGTVDFLVLPDSGSDPVKERRKREYCGARLPTGGRILRTERPYTAGGLRDLMQRVGELKASPVARGKLRALYDLLFHDSYLQTQFEALEVRERLVATGALDRREREEGPLKKWVEELEFFPFRPAKDGDGWTTPLSELVEAYEFVRLGYDPDPTKTKEDGDG